ncbi:MAG: hypothetical protein GOVbin1923_58 [Prokaryotic dsDNA virus sp.]|nr:MAG: hypothetical protein GOVbin1923_58 [Prokaryotic dsDNA virus sp.]|tara:strand:- start:3905 stop:5374 length:1470 start_codon:yes stop_codon:yes gene_type:complete
MDEPWLNLNITERIKPWVLDGYLTDYQKEAWDWSTRRAGANLWWACGAGKTLAGLLWLVSGPHAERKLIVTRAPAKSQWKCQAAQYTDLRPTVMEGFTSVYIPDDTECIIVSWEMLKHWLESIQYWCEGRRLAIVWDEIHKGKSWRRKEKYVTFKNGVGWRYMDNRAAAAAQLSELASRRLGLTATPIRDRRSDLWAQLDLVQPGEWGSNMRFIKQYCDASPNEWGGWDATGVSNCAELHEKLTRVTHRVSYAEMSRTLPPKRRQLIYLSAHEQNKSVGFVTEFKKLKSAGQKAKFEMQLMEAAARKRAWLVETIHDLLTSGQKVTVFTGRRKDCEKLYAAIAKKMKKTNIPVLSGHGGDSLKVRQELVTKYAELETACAFVGTTDAFGEAIDGLQNTDTVFFALLPYTPGQIVQAEGRFSRHGSTRPVLISYVICEGTVDEHVADLLLAKLEAVEATLGDEEAGNVARTLAGEDDEEAIINQLLTIKG